MKSQGMGGQAWQRVVPQTPALQGAIQIPRPTGSQYMQPQVANQLGLPGMPRALGQYAGYPSIDQRIDPNKPIGPGGIMPSQTSVYAETRRKAGYETPKAQEQPAGPKVTPFLWNMMSNMRDMDVESRTEYLETVAAGIKDKLDRYAMRLARGVPLTPEQDKRYQSLRDAFNDIQRYATNQEDYDKYLSAYGKEGGASAPAEYEAWRVGQYRR
jgi:hypothetical protein